MKTGVVGAVLVLAILLFSFQPFTRKTTEEIHAEPQMADTFIWQMQDDKAFSAWILSEENNEYISGLFSDGTSDLEREAFEKRLFSVEDEEMREELESKINMIKQETDSDGSDYWLNPVYPHTQEEYNEMEMLVNQGIAFSKDQTENPESGK